VYFTPYVLVLRDYLCEIIARDAPRDAFPDAGEVGYTFSENDTIVNANDGAITIVLEDVHIDLIETDFIV
jgi:hypothetical protein